MSTIVVDPLADPGEYDAAASQRRCLRHRHRILDISQQVSALHAAGAFSAMEMVDCIYHGVMRRHPDRTSPDTAPRGKA